MEKKTYTPITPELTKNAITVLERALSEAR